MCDLNEVKGMRLNMKESELVAQSNLVNSKHVDEDMRDLFGITFTTYKLSENYHMIYKNDPECTIPRKLIELYVKYINPDYNSMIYSFKKKYISNEVLVEKNDTKEQRQGLRAVYDYIQNYDITQKTLDIFVSTLEINGLLWAPTDKKNNEEIETMKNDLTEKIELLMKQAKEEKNAKKFKEARDLKQAYDSLTHKSKIGAQLRSNNYEDEVRLLNTGISVPKASEALEFMNHYISKEKKQEFDNTLKNADVISYITYCVKETTKMIYHQPFMDGNKRTFRALLNLMFKVRGLPPVYIKTTEREEYKDALIKAMKEEDYSEIVGFYLFKICDSIYELDVEPYRLVQKKIKR